MIFKKIVGITLAVALLVSMSPIKFEAIKLDNRYYMGETVNAGKDKGYSKSDRIDKEDIHYNWKLGEFYVEGHTREEKDADGNPIFLKNVGDEVTLCFDLQQDINKLNGNENLYICDDTNGYMEKYGIEKTNLEKGTLIIRYTDYQNKTGDAQVYTNYLLAKESENANTKVLICEEGDYEVCLLYEVKNDGVLFLDSYENYKIEFQFSVRNGNTMVFPFDVITGQELGNSSFTENGFYLDLANSHYLTVDVKRELWIESSEGWTPDIRFNKVAADGEKYTDEGIYTITVKNPYTNGVTKKKIYVGTNNILKAYVTTGLSIKEIEASLDNGATIDENGKIISTNSIKEPITKETETKDNTSNIIVDEQNPTEKKNSVWIVIVSLLVIAVVVSILTVIKKR